ncbi:MAG TPA: hypothetical protein VIB59_00380 [Solirubrobacteraceae bacterium]
MRLSTVLSALVLLATGAVAGGSSRAAAAVAHPLAHRTAAPAVAHPRAQRAAAPAFLLGVNAGYWGRSEPRDLRRVADIVRLTNPPRLTRWERQGLRVIADFSGPYSRGGVTALDHAAYVARVIRFVTENPRVFAIEVLNEPGGQWFWGAQAESAANRESYAQLLIEVHDALVRSFGARRPLELASWDGGHDSSNAWGEAWSLNATALADVDAVTNHPYGGRGSRAKASLGNRRVVEADEAVSHKPIYITEVGFPTIGPTDDSLRYSEAEQASAIRRFALWARRTGYVAGVTFYGYRDAREGGGYGIETHRGRHKPAFRVLEKLHRG